MYPALLAIQEPANLDTTFNDKLAGELKALQAEMVTTKTKADQCATIASDAHAAEVSATHRIHARR